MSQTFSNTLPTAGNGNVPPNEFHIIMKPRGEGRSLPDKHLLKTIAQGHLYRDKLLSGKFGSIADLAKSEAVDLRHLSRVLKLAFLSPKIIDAICNGSEPEDLTTEALLKMNAFPMDWQEQEKASLIAELGEFHGVCQQTLLNRSKQRKSQCVSALKPG